MINEKGTIYYGTSIKYIKDIDKNGLYNPRVRNEQYISVSVSGYESPIDIMHEDIEKMARVFSKEIGICIVRNNKLHYKNGYRNSLTHIQGFGPNRNDYLLSIYGLVDNNRSQDTIVAVIGKEHADYLVHPDRENKFEYMSLALHGFIRCIMQEHIKGWIVSRKHYNDIKEKMLNGELKQRELWVDDEFEKILYVEDEFYKYSFDPGNIDTYIRNISKRNYYQETKLRHLNHILSDVYPIKEEDLEGLEERLSNWYSKNKEELVWHQDKYKYLIRQENFS